MLKKKCFSPTVDELSPCTKSMDLKVLSPDHVYLFACLRFFVHLRWICRIMLSIALWHLKKKYKCVYRFKNHCTPITHSIIFHIPKMYFTLSFINSVIVLFLFLDWLFSVILPFVITFYSFDLWWLMLTFMSLHFLFSHLVWKKSH